MYADAAIDIFANTDLTMAATDFVGINAGGNVEIIGAVHADFAAGSGALSLYNNARSFGFNSSGTFLIDGGAAASPTTEFFRGDGTWAVPAGGGGVTASNGLTAVASNVTLGGALTANTTITGGAVFDLFLGGTAADRLDLFLVRTSGGFQLESAGGFAKFFINSSGAGEWTTTSVADIVSSTDAAGGVRLQRMSKQTAAADSAIIGTFNEYANRVSGASNGFGSRFQYALSTTAGILVQDIAYDFSVSWADATDGANYSNFNQRVRVNDVMTDAVTVTTSSTAPNIFISLAGLLRLPDLPTSSAGLVSGDVWNNSGVLNIV
jgi:hypothetical protein